MWDSNADTSSTNHQRETEWFTGAFNLPIAKPASILKWETNVQCYELITKHFPKQRAINQLDDLSVLALAWTTKEVKSRLTFTPNAQGQSVAPTVFALDPDGACIQLGLRLRSIPPTIFSGDSTADGAVPDKISIVKQKAMLDEMVADGAAAETDRQTLLYYTELTDAEFLYVRELVRVYDSTRCYFLQWVVDKEIKALVNGARLAHVHNDMQYTWLQAKADITTPLVDITATARLMALLLERRPNNMLAKLWIAGRAAHRAMLEAKTNPHPISLPETTYLTLTLGQMSDQELRDFDLPGIGDNLDEINLSGTPMWTMTALKKAVEACTKPPKYRAVSTPVTKLLDQYSSSAPPAKDPKPPKDSNRRNPRPNDRSNYPLNKDKGKKELKPAYRNRVDHENFAKFPKGMRRPDPSQTVGGKKISNETQQKLYDDIKHNRCTRCHLSGHFRANCTKPVKAFEKAFDTQKAKYWQGLCHWQQKASDDTTLESNACSLLPSH
jgi:hypothetical protein